MLANVLTSHLYRVSSPKNMQVFSNKRSLNYSFAITLKTTDDIAQAATAMIEKQIRRLPVVDDGKLMGTVSCSDICRAVIYYA